MTNLYFHCNSCNDKRLASKATDFKVMVEYQCEKCYLFTQVAKIQYNSDLAIRVRKLEEKEDKEK